MTDIERLKFCLDVLETIALGNINLGDDEYKLRGNGQLFAVDFLRDQFKIGKEDAI